MSSDGVHASPADVRKLAAALGKYQSEVKEASKSVQSALNAANWHDKQKTQFESRYRDLQKSVDRFMAGEVSTMIKSLNELARRLEEIRTMKL